MNVIGYVRVSTSGQAKEGYSLAYQQAEIRSYCQEQGWDLKHVFTDEGISGAKVDENTLEVNRIGFQSLLSALSTRTYEPMTQLSCLIQAVYGGLTSLRYWFIESSKGTVWM